MKKEKIVQFSAIGFIISAIGAAVGLGNIWWFPQRMAENGGSSFIIVYLIVLFLLAFPVVLLEVNYGVFFRKGVTGCLSKTGGTFGRLVAWKQIFLVGFLGVYYLVVLSWIGISFVVSAVPAFFRDWSSDQNWFNEKILATTGEGIKFAPWVLLGSLVLVGLTFLIVNGGIKKGLENANYLFVPGLFVMLIGLTVYALFFRKYAQAGAEVLFTFEIDKMTDPFVWYTAIKQVIFSTGILLGILVVFSKNSNVRMDKGNDAIIIVVADTFIALIAGLFIGGLVAHQTGMELEQVKGGTVPLKDVIAKVKVTFQSGKIGGTNLLFKYLPPLFWEMNNGSNFGLGNALMMTFALTLLFAGISSLIAIVQCFVDPIKKNLSLKGNGALLIWASFTIVLLLFYSTSLGGGLLDNQDAIVLHFIILIGIVEVAMFTFSSQYKKVITHNDQHTFLKLGKLHWLKILIALITLPLLVFLGIFGTMNLFGINYLIVNSDFFAKIKDEHQILQDFAKQSKKFVFTKEQIASLVMFGFSVFLSFWFTLISSPKYNLLKAASSAPEE